MDAHGPAAPPDTHTRILDAVERIIVQKGVTGLTLEAAAREAGVSKGGLLYHFGSKEALLTGLMQRLTAFITQEYEAGVARQPEGPGRIARAQIAWASAKAIAALARIATTAPPLSSWRCSTTTRRCSTRCAPWWHG